MSVLILGNGLVAQAVAAELPNAVVVGHDRFDIRDHDSLVRLVREERPDACVNTVAMHKLAECEAGPTEAFDINAKGAERIASLVPTLYISTDYVFDSGGPHDEAMPGRQPRSVYGRSKLAGELATLEHDGIVVRISGVFDERFESHKGRSFAEMVASTYSDLRLPNDQVFSPTYAKDAAERIVGLVRGMSERVQADIKGIFHAANAGSVSWADFAKYISTRAGRPRRKIAGFEAKDPIRPTNSALRSTRLMPLRSWMLATDAWIEARQARLYVTRPVSPLRGNA